ILSYLAVEKAVERHCGKLEEIYSPAGKMLLQRGKDLSNIGYVIGTGGALAYSRTPQKILSAALYNPARQDILKPIKPRFLVDEQYILYAVGLLSQSDSEKAFKLANKYLKEIHNNLQAN
ncbi:MAG: glutamate mutase L, partial [Dehalococcoidales bacterium]|nr:glutamate mutase L [Dehalococcoidales bacterium]